MNKPMWVINQQANKSLDIYLYDDIKSDSYSWWTEELIKSETSANHVKQILEQAGDIEQINLYINSYGGSVKEGLGIYNQLKRKNSTVTAYIDGFACSIASVIAMAADKVIMGTNSLMMIHHASMGAYGNAEELRKAANDVEVIDKASCSSYLQKAGDKLTEEKLTELLDNQTWLSADQCLMYGLADEIAGAEDKTIEEAKQRYKASVEQEMNGIKPEIKVPEQYSSNKSNAEKLMMMFKKKMEE